MARVIAEDFALDASYEDGVVENTIVNELKDDTEIERLKQSNSKLLLENEKLTLENRRYESDTRLRNNFAYGYSIILVIWIFTVICILLHNRSSHYHFSDTVLIALLTTSTANVFGMVLIVLKNLFPTPKE